MICFVAVKGLAVTAADTYVCLLASSQMLPTQNTADPSLSASSGSGWQICGDDEFMGRLLHADDFAVLVYVDCESAGDFGQSWHEHH